MRIDSLLLGFEWLYESRAAPATGTGGVQTWNSHNLLERNVLYKSIAIARVANLIATTRVCTNTECWSQGRAKLRAFPRHLAQENTQLSPSLTPTLGTYIRAC